MTDNMHKLVGIGFGPSNIALAIALEETLGRRRLVSDVAFFEKQSHSQWHPNMLLPGAVLQVSFLKDLVSLRNPTSSYSFVNFLQHAGRLEEFVNLGTLFPLRSDFNQYVQWAADQFRDITRWGQAIVEAKPVRRGPGRVAALEIVTEDGSSYLTEHLAVAVGGRPNIPVAFQNLMGERVFHASQYLRRVPEKGELAGKRCIVVGAGQSAAEIIRHLAGQAAEVVSIHRDFAIRSADDSHFINEVFYPSVAENTFSLKPEQRRQFVSSMRSTNYAVADRALIADLYRLRYEGALHGDVPFHFLSQTEITNAGVAGDEVWLHLQSLAGGGTSQITADYVILATGYQRVPLPECISALVPNFCVDDAGCPVLDRDFRVRTTDDFQPSVYLLGYAEHSHGISDTLLSLNAYRAGVIADSVAPLMGADRAAPSLVQA